MNDVVIAQQNDILVSLSGVEKKYVSAGETLVILDKLDAEIYRGSNVIITGESGSGKSTLLNLIGGLDVPTAGTIRAGNFQVDRLSEDGLTKYRSQFLGLIFQFHYLLKDFTALENVMLPAYIAGLSKKEATIRAKQLLSDVNLEDRMAHLPSQLSGGERQRAAVARALVGDPQLILADEPTGNLDPANSAVVEDVLFSMVSRYKKTMLLVTHDMALASRGDRCLHLDHGRLSESGVGKGLSYDA